MNQIGQKSTAPDYGRRHANKKTNRMKEEGGNITMANASKFAERSEKTSERSGLNVC